MKPGPTTDLDEVAAAREVLRQLELDVGRRLDGILHGDHRGLVPGHGSEPGEARLYQPGDDVRRIDWNVTARSNAMHVRETIADRELETWMLVDRSASLSFGTAEREKADVALAAAAGIGVLTNQGGNRIGALVVDNERASVIPARQGRAHLLGLLTSVRQATRGEGAPALSLSESIRRLDAVAQRRGLAVVISDFLDDPAEWRHALGALVAKHHVMCVEVVDPRELELPNAGRMSVIDTETGTVREINTSSKRLRDRYASAALEQRAEIAAALRSAGAEHLQLRTDRDWLLDMARFVLTRRRRLANVATPASGVLS